MGAQSFQDWRRQTIQKLSAFPRDNGLDSVYEKELTKECQKYAELSCRALSQEMRTKLPREIRDLIYRFILGESKVCLGKSDHYNGHGPASYYVRPFDVLYWRQIPQRLLKFWSMSLLGGDLFSELVTCWYRVTRLYLDDTTLIKTLVSPAKRGERTPPIDYIHNVYFTIRETRDFRESSHDVDGFPAAYNRMVSNLQLFLLFQPGTRIRIRLHSEQLRHKKAKSYVWKPDNAVKFVQTLTWGEFGRWGDAYYSVVQCLRDLHKAGFRVTVTLDEVLELSTNTGFSTKIWVEEVRAFDPSSIEERWVWPNGTPSTGGDSFVSF